jgi:hypothetical protein
MIAVFVVFLTVIFSLLVTRVATVMLTLTGMSRESARFQARSAFSGTGFTTTESETVVNHPVRRRVIMSLILLGNAGIVSGLAALLLSFNAVTGSSDAALRLTILTLGLVLLWRFAASQIVDRAMSRVIERALRRFTDLDVRDYAGLLRLADQWLVGEIEVEEGDWLCDVPLSDLGLSAEGVLVLGIERADGRWVGAPNRDSRLHDGDIAVIYGKRDTLERIDARERTAEGELDWVSSQVEFTAEYLEQQEIDRAADPDRPEMPPIEPKLAADDRPDDSDGPASDAT